MIITQIIAIFFDEIDRLYSMIFKLLLAVLMVSTAMLYIRLGGQKTRSRVLIAGVLLCLLVAEAGLIAYWQPLGGVDIPAAIAWGLVILGILFSPALILRRGWSTGGRSAQA